jgi:hypothetical protein
MLHAGRPTRTVSASAKVILGRAPQRHRGPSDDTEIRVMVPKKILKGKEEEEEGGISVLITLTHRAR